MAEDERRQKILRYRILEQQMTQLQQQLELLEQNLAEVGNTLSAIDDLKLSKPGSSMLAPLSSGIFVQAKLQDNDTFIVNVGSNVTVQKKSDEVKKILDSQSKEIIEMRDEMVKGMEQLASQMNSLETELG